MKLKEFATPNGAGLGWRPGMERSKVGVRDKMFVRIQERSQCTWSVWEGKWREKRLERKALAVNHRILVKEFGFYPEGIKKALIDLK